MEKKFAYPLAVLVYFIVMYIIGFTATVVITMSFGVYAIVTSKTLIPKVSDRMSGNAKVFIGFMISIVTIVFWISPLSMIDILFEDEE